MRLPQASPMLGAFAAFEFKYQLRSTMFFVTAAIFPRTHVRPVQNRTRALRKYSGSTHPRNAARSVRPSRIARLQNPG